jgi:hypothetical protein
MTSRSSFGKNDHRILLILLLTGLVMIFLIRTLKAQNPGFSEIPFSWNDPDREGNNSFDISTQSADDAVFVLKLPFTFSFCGKGFSECYASTNGTISFEKPFSNFYNKTSDIDIPIIAAYWDDLSFNYDCASSAWKYETTGLAPSRCFIVTWNSFIRNDGSCSNSISFQARLYEDSGNIEISIFQNSLNAKEPGNMGVYSSEENTIANYQSGKISYLWSHEQTQKTSAYLK